MDDMIIFIIKKIVYALCLLYTVNIFISKVGKIIPINIYTIILVTIFDFFAVFLVVTLVTAVFGLLSSTGDEDIENQSKSGLDCWDEIKK